LASMPHSAAKAPSAKGTRTKRIVSRRRARRADSMGDRMVASVGSRACQALVWDRDRLQMCGNAYPSEASGARHGLCRDGAQRPALEGADQRSGATRTKGPPSLCEESPAQRPATEGRTDSAERLGPRVRRAYARKAQRAAGPRPVTEGQTDSGPRVRRAYARKAKRAAGPRPALEGQT